VLSCSWQLMSVCLLQKLSTVQELSRIGELGAGARHTPPPFSRVKTRCRYYNVNEYAFQVGKTNGSGQT
jgi:hypothetical protein